MNIIIDNISYNLKKTIEEADFVQYEVFKNDNLIGYVVKADAEILYTARDKQMNLCVVGETIREALEEMLLHTFYKCTFTGYRFIQTFGKWIEGEKLKVEFERNNVVKHAERVVKYSAAAGDLYITIDNNKYFYYEFR